MCENHIFPNFNFTQAILVSIKRAVVWASVSPTDTGVLYCALFFFFFDEIVVSTGGFPFQLFVGHHPTKCIMKKAMLLPNKQSCILYLANQRALLASISEEVFTLRDLARLVMHKNKLVHSNKKLFFRM